MKKKKIVAVTGSRSEYDIIYSVLDVFNRDDKYELSVIVTGSHLSEYFGYTFDDIKRDNFEIGGVIHSLINSDHPIGKAKSSGILLSGLADRLAYLDPDYVLVAGDREEPIISAIASTYLKIPLIHIAGGDRTFAGGTISDVDEPTRHATSKMASLHFTMAKEHSERLIRMGEEKWRVVCSGNPALDRFKSIEKISKKRICEYFQIESYEKPLVLVIQHVLSGEHAEGKGQLQTTLDALLELDINCIVNYPNSDYGSQGIIELLTSKSIKNNPKIRISKNIPRDVFVNLIRNIDVLVGNSSMAFCEGSYLRLPAVNVGRRQGQRLNGGNVVFADHDKEAIKSIVHKILNDEAYSEQLKSCDQIYGNGNAANNILMALDNLSKTREELIAKDITY